MKIKRFYQKGLAAICLIIMVLSFAVLAQEQEDLRLVFKSFSTPPGFNLKRANAVAKALAFQNWPQTKINYVAPIIGKSMLSKPGLVTRSSTSYSLAEFEQMPWGKCHLSWARLIKNDQPLPRELPPDRKKALLDRIPEDKKKDSEFVREYLKRKLERYQKSRQYLLDGELMIEVCLTPGSSAVREYLLAAMTESSLPTENLVSMYSNARHEEGIGTLNFITEFPQKNRTDIKFVRGNVYISIRASGCFAGEALPLARKIDARIVSQPPLTREQLLSRRPGVKIAAQLKNKVAVPYDILVPPGQKIARMQAFVDNRRTTITGKTIGLAGKKGKQKVKFIIVTDELLACISEKEIDVSN